MSEGPNDLEVALQEKLRAQEELQPGHAAINWPEPTKTAKLTEEEHLRFKMLGLQQENFAYRKALALQEAQSINALGQHLKKESADLRSYIATKYSMNPEKLRVTTTGIVEEAP